MKCSLRATLVAAAAACAAGYGHAAARALDEAEMSQVQAAGLSPLTLQSLSQERGLAAQELAARLVLPEVLLAAERHQAPAQMRLATGSLQLGGAVMQGLALAGLATPMAPLLLPALALPLPLLGLMPPQTPPKH